MNELLNTLLPWRLANKDFLNMLRDEDRRTALRSMEENKLGHLLGHLGFQFQMQQNEGILEAKRNKPYQCEEKQMEGQALGANIFSAGFLRHLHSPISGPGALSASTNSKYNTIALMLQQYCLPRKDSTSFHPIFSVAGKFVLVAASRDSQIILWIIPNYPLPVSKKMFIPILHPINATPNPSPVAQSNAESQDLTILAISNQVHISYSPTHIPSRNKPKV